MENKKINLEIELMACNSNINPQPKTAIFYKNSIYYACSNLLIQFDKGKQKVTKTKKFSEKGEVCFIELFKENILAIGSTKGEISLMNLENQEVTLNFKINTKIKFLNYFSCQEKNYLLVGSENFLNIYEIKKSQILLEELKFGNNFLETSSILNYKTQTLILLSGCDYLIYVYNFKNSKINFLNSLPGHQNKIKAITVSPSKNPKTTLFASGGLDNYIRIWKIKELEKIDIQNKNIYPLENNLIIELETILLSHTEGVTGLIFTDKGLISCGLDCSVIIWEKNEENVWINSNRFGQMYGNKNVFFGVCCDQEMNEILAWTFTGSPYYWVFCEGQWKSTALFSGHFKEVMDLKWDKGFNFLVSCSVDQTTRVFGEVKENKEFGVFNRWTEFSRAQIHGYDINSIALLNIGGDFCDFIICGADEKVLRVLEPLPHFINSFNVSTGNDLRLFFNNDEEEKNFLISEKPRVYKVFQDSGVEVLGLMTKAFKEEKVNFYYKDKKIEHQNENYKVEDYHKLSSEDFLATQTLWPEANKLYGHGYEISVVAARQDGKVVVSAAKSNTKKYSSLIFWDLKNFKIDYSIESHNYTILDIKFFNDKIVTVSKDREIALYKLNKKTNKYEFNKEKDIQKGHSRLIKSITVNSKGNMLVTGSRDKHIKVWKIEDGKLKEIQKRKIGVYVKAVEFFRDDVLLLGLDDGRVLIARVSEEDFEVVGEIMRDVGFGKSINKIRRCGKKGSDLFACCSEDHTVRVYKLNIK